MKTINFPDTRLQVSEICMGNPLGGDLNHYAAYALLDTYTEQGGNFLDTAHVYNDWIPGEKSRSEKLIGAWMKERRNRSQLVIATKGAHPRLESMNVARLSPTEILSDLEESLQYLQIDTIDLYWLHRDDPTRPVAEILETLNAAVKAGKVRHYGASNWNASRLAEAQGYALQHKIQPFIADQVLWNAAVVDPGCIPDKTTQVMDEQLIAYHKANNFPAIPYTSQANGLFDRMDKGTWDKMNPNVRQFYPEAPNRARLERIRLVARECGKTVNQIVLGFLLSQPFITVPIIGPKNVTQLLDSLSAAGTGLTLQQIDFLTR